MSHHGNDTTILITIDIKDAENRVKIHRDQQLQGVSGQELSIYHTRDGPEDLRVIKGQSMLKVNPIDIPVASELPTPLPKYPKFISGYLSTTLDYILHLD